MVKNTKGGKKSRKTKGGNDFEKRELIYKEDSQEYAKVTKMLGNARIEADCYDGTTRLCGIRGKMRKRIWITVGDIILVSLRDFQDDRGDVIHKYTPDEARSLKAYGELPENAKINEIAEIEFGSDKENEDEIEFCFDEIDDI